MYRPQDINLFEKKTRTSEELKKNYIITGIIPHYTGLNTSVALSMILGSQVLCIAPKSVHEVFKKTNPNISIVTQQMYLKHPTLPETILFLRSAHSHSIVSTVLTRRKG